MTYYLLFRTTLASTVIMSSSAGDARPSSAAEASAATKSADRPHIIWKDEAGAGQLHEVS